MKILLYTAFAVTAFLYLCLWSGGIGFTYPHVIAVEPLQHPVRIVSITGNDLLLEDGRTITLDASGEQQDWDAVFKQSRYRVDVTSPREGEVAVFANQDGWICGTPWAGGLRIPLIPQTVYKNRRQLVGYGNIQGTPATGPPQPAGAP